ncbi:hypothetical protein GWI33_021865 [Rhynchophorus ferrugineus]|uniref:Uncharacterized protein n=1 Tax=Rhynchophorus ferrugineus TaxID=354439 RepID=A0A834LYG1_RHYFE|nr:hypothetical protein GWI33_021865 [Rhynchophorus ferrugineus]
MKHYIANKVTNEALATNNHPKPQNNYSACLIKLRLSPDTGPYLGTFEVFNKWRSNTGEGSERGRLKCNRIISVIRLASSYSEELFER